jgi:hypothetical protein
MKNTTAKFLYLLIDIIESMVWAFKNNYLFEAWRNMPEQKWARLEAPSMKSIICAPSISECLDQAKILTLEATEKSHKPTLTEILINTAKENVKHNKNTINERHLTAFQKIGEDIKKHGSVCVNEFGERQ